MKFIPRAISPYIKPKIKNDFRRLKHLIFKNKYLKQWKRQGHPLPPPHVYKQGVIKDFASTYDIKIFVETGTFLGDMVAAQKSNFDIIFSIELSNELWLCAKKRFARYPNIIILHGDSGKVLKRVVPLLEKPSLFWLDGHYSGGITQKGDSVCPIYNELQAIFNSNIKNHIILIDDARLFESDKDYPRLSDLLNFLKTQKPDCDIKIEFDIIRVVLK